MLWASAMVGNTAATTDLALANLACSPPPSSSCSAGCAATDDSLRQACTPPGPAASENANTMQQQLMPAQSGHVNGAASGASLCTPVVPNRMGIPLAANRFAALCEDDDEEHEGSPACCVPQVLSAAMRPLPAPSGASQPDLPRVYGRAADRPRVVGLILFAAGALLMCIGLLIFCGFDVAPNNTEWLNFAPQGHVSDHAASTPADCPVKFVSSYCSETNTPMHLPDAPGNSNADFHDGNFETDSNHSDEEHWIGLPSCAAHDDTCSLDDPLVPSNSPSGNFGDLENDVSDKSDYGHAASTHGSFFDHNDIAALACLSAHHADCLAIVAKSTAGIEKDMYDTPL